MEAAFKQELQRQAYPFLSKVFNSTGYVLNISLFVESLITFVDHFLKKKKNKYII